MTYIENIYFDRYSFILSIIFYIIRVYPSYIMAKKANLKNPWIIVIPVLGELKILHLAGLSYWYFILTFIPFINIILNIVVFYKIMTNFGFKLIITILGIIFSFIAFISFWYIVLAKKEFVGYIPKDYQNY